MQDTARDIGEGGKNAKVGKLIIMSGPSGGGKTTMLLGDKRAGVPGILDRLPTLHFLTSNTTRAPRANEKHGTHYNFWKLEDFQENIKNNGFLEFAEYSGNYYGTSRREVEALLKEGKDVLLITEVNGCRQILEASFVDIAHPEIITIFIAPPNLEVLRHRLEARSDVAHTLEKRLKAAEREIEEGKKVYGHVVLNEEGQLEKAISDVVGIISGRE